jgi:hypothetical protein
MKWIFLFVGILFLPVLSPAHPLHLSITNITYENGTLNIQMKSFRDDWEVGYFHYHSKPIDFNDPANREIPWFKDYLYSKFRISTGKEKPELTLVLDTVYVEADALNLKMHAEVPSNPNSLYIYNALLTDIYPDQTNLVIFVFENKETGIKFDIQKHDAEVILR